jgi:hypothetical protein
MTFISGCPYHAGGYRRGERGDLLFQRAFGLNAGEYATFPGVNFLISAGYER